MDKLNFKVGDVIKVLTKDTQEKKVHASSFEGVVISIRGQKDTQTFTVRKKCTDNVFVERIFPTNAPVIEKIISVKQNSPRRAKLYYLRKKAK